MFFSFFFFQAEDGIRDLYVTGVQTCALPISSGGNGWCGHLPSTGSCSAPDAGAGGLVFSVDLCKGPARQVQPPATPVPVSPYVYGINAGAFVATGTKWGMIRQGGDDNSAYNWTNDY